VRPRPELALKPATKPAIKPVSKKAKDAPRATSAATADSAGSRGGYTVLARRYRSREFDELIGQEAIAQTLRNAIAQGRVAHAYLFTGTRGVGKTSMARLFAKALNVSDELGEADEIAAAILRGDDMDVIEIDGASNRGIDGARDLIAAAGIAPARCRHKIYIIDEVHMLTTAAFNALLKTMEEPPSHVKFILCTTEAHAVPATIQSRCQRFDFRSIPATRIAAHLREVLEKESVGFDEQAVMQVARLANGSMRDGLSLLDRLIAGVDPGGILDPALLERMLGLPDQSLVHRIFDGVADGDAGRALAETEVLLQRGQTLDQALETFVDHLRTLMLIVACGPESELVERSGEARAAAIAQASRFDAAGLVHMIALCEATSRSVRVSGAGRALLDALVVRMSLAAHMASIPALLSGRLAAPPTTGATASGAATAASTASDEKKKPLSAPEPRRDAPNPAASEAPAPVAAAVKAPSSNAPTHSPAIEFDDVEAIWNAARALAAKAPRDEALVADLETIAIDGSTLRLRAVADEPTMRKALVGSSALVADLVRRATGRAVTVVIEADPDTAPSSRSAPTDLAELAAHPLVREASTLFEARVVGVRPIVETADAEDDEA